MAAVAATCSKRPAGEAEDPFGIGADPQLAAGAGSPGRRCGRPPGLRRLEAIGGAEPLENAIPSSAAARRCRCRSTAPPAASSASA